MPDPIGLELFPREFLLRGDFNSVLTVRGSKCTSLEFLASMLTMGRGILERRLSPVGHNDVNVPHAPAGVSCLKRAPGRKRRHGLQSPLSVARICFTSVGMKVN